MQVSLDEPWCCITHKKQQPISSVHALLSRFNCTLLCTLDKQSASREHGRVGINVVNNAPGLHVRMAAEKS